MKCLSDLKGWPAPPCWCHPARMPVPVRRKSFGWVIEQTGGNMEMNKGDER